MDMGEVACPHCRCTDAQVRAGKSGDSQRYKCGQCGRRYIPVMERRPRGVGDAVRAEARRLHDAGSMPAEIALRLGVSARSVSGWLRPPPEVPSLPPPTPEIPPPPTLAEEPSRWRRRPTIHDVAAQAQVSISTVSNYLNQRGRMSEATTRRIRAAIESLNFTPSALTRALRQHRTHILGVYIGGLDILDEAIGDSITLPLLAGINRGAGAGEHNLLHFTGYERHARRTRGQPFLDGHIDGLIWVAPPMNAPALERLAAAGLPVVALLSRHVPDGVGYVNADNSGALCAMVLHLAAQGHRRIAYLGSVHDSNHWDRRDGYRAGLAAAGLPRVAALEVTTEQEGDWTPEGFDGLTSFDRALDRLFALSAPPTALVCPDDGIALSLGRRLQRLGRSLTLAGFNDSPAAAQANLTSVRQPLRAMGEKAAERLVALIGGASADDCRVTFPTELVIRASTTGTFLKGEFG